MAKHYEPSRWTLSELALVRETVAAFARDWREIEQTEVPDFQLAKESLQRLRRTLAFASIEIKLAARKQEKWQKHSRHICSDSGFQET